MELLGPRPQKMFLQGTERTERTTKGRSKTKKINRRKRPDESKITGKL